MVGQLIAGVGVGLPPPAGGGNGIVTLIGVPTASGVGIASGVIEGTGVGRSSTRCTWYAAVSAVALATPVASHFPLALAALNAGKHVFSEDRKSLTVYSALPARAILDLVKWIDQHGIELSDIHLKRPTLEDVFIELTGKRLRE